VSRVGRLAVSFGLVSLALLPAADPTPAARLPGPDPVVAAAGDISCAQGPDGSSSCRDQATSDLLVGQGLARVLALGDTQYESGELSAFESYYDPTWGRVKEITSPSPGNHDPFSSGYAAYFGSRAPAPYYSYDIGQWHLISLDSNDVDSTQVSWLRSDLAANAGGKCVLAYWHRPRFSSGTTHGNGTRVAPFWTELYSAGADVVLSSHEHNYERFAPQDPNGMASARGIRQFVVGTGGRSHYPFGVPQPNSEARGTGTFGVLELALRPGGYEWLFVPVAGQSFSDSGTGVCNSAAPVGYPRPISASPFRVSLVPSYAKCTAPNATHGPPLDQPSCRLPVQASQFLTVGTPDANGEPPVSVGSLRLGAIVGNPATLEDEADFKITHVFNDIRKRVDRSDYAGELRVLLSARITDRLNGPSATEAATVADLSFPATVGCEPTPGPEGSDCTLTTTANTVMPGAVTEGKRAIWALERVAVYDGGADGQAATTDGNTLFATQGVFVP
jgi:hypothetical protein